jgi:hypothetical protein
VFREAHRNSRQQTDDESVLRVDEFCAQAVPCQCRIRHEEARLIVMGNKVDAFNSSPHRHTSRNMGSASVNRRNWIAKFLTIVMGHGKKSLAISLNDKAMMLRKCQDLAQRSR